MSPQVRRFVCGNSSCGWRTFAEQIAGLTWRHGRWTARLRSTLAAIGLATAGRAGARLATVFGVSTSRSRALRLVDELPDLEPSAPPVMGVDEYATREGRDRTAVISGITLRWNSGVVEGHVTRLQMLQRQMFGRAGFALLRKGVLLAS
ncbi:hypothetical protein ACFP3U_18530 [Kitasatospora misakiensis]|uniref:Transposase n=1 Tax=Kitasatospora misakiensis TaxID=67330 RepID=A0ABW0X3E8_9ACTN